MAAIDYVAVVQQLYVSYFGRPADYYGLQSFTAQLDALKAPTDFEALNALVQKDKTNTTALSKLVNSFNASAESASLYGTDNSTIGLSKFVAAIYTNVLGREADVEGLTFWVNEIAAGRLTRANAAMAITDGALANTSAQGLLDAKTVENKLAVATNFTDALDTVSEINGFSGDKAAAQARDLLAQVKDTTDPVAFQATVDTTIATIVTGSLPSTTTLLTTGIDTFAGTAANDTIKALSSGVKADGSDATTLGANDSIDGGAGNDTLFIEVNALLNGTQQGTVKNVETINIDNSAATTGFGGTAVDASKFEGATQIWQIGKELAINKLAATTTAGFRNIATAQTFDVAPADDAAKATVAFDKVAEASTLNVVATGTGVLNSVVVSGTVVDTNADDSVAATNVAVTVGKDVQTLTVNSAVNTVLTITDGAGTKKVTTIDASASTGAIKYADSETTVTTINTGSGKDDVTLVAVTAKDVVATAADETINASVNTGAGNDKVTVNVTGDGKTTIVTGAGNDTVAITGRGTSVLTIDLGDGSDTFTSGVPINSTDSIDAGAGTDTLLLSLVGSANVGAFKNFDIFDVKGMGGNLDLDILNAANTVTEIVGSGALGVASVTLQNVAAGVNFRATADMGTTNQLTLTQKTAGALTVTLDADETGTADAGDDVAGVSVAANAATSISAVFDTAYLGKAGAVAGETAATDNVSTIALATQAATTISVVSGGAFSKNVLNVTEGTGTDALTTVTVTGDSALTLSVNGASKLATVDASAATGGLTFDLTNLKDGGSVKLGSGVDAITVTNTSTLSLTANPEAIVGLEKAAAVAVSAVAGDAVAKAAAIADADTLVFAGGSVAVDAGNIAKGVLSFTGAGPATLADAVALADTATTATVGAAVVFQYLNDSYVFVQGATDIVVKLTGVTGVTNFVETGTDHFFIV